MQTSQFDINAVAGVKTDMMKSLCTGTKTLDQLVMLPKFHNISSRVLAIALEELVFERMIEVNNDTYSIHQR